MISFGVVLLVSVIALAVLMLGAVWAMNKAAARLVGDKHQLLQTIVETGQVPPGWSRPFQRKIARLATGGGASSQLAALQERARGHYLDRLDDLVHYVENSPLVDGDDTRRLLLARLAEVRTAWQDKA